MKYSIVTCYYNIRKSRDIDYYLLPLNDLIDDLSSTDIDLYVFTDVDQILNKSYSSNIHICNLSFQELIEDIWEDKNWSNIYQKHLKNRDGRRFEEKNLPNLLSIWLGKFKMIEIAAANSDYVLWQDCGIRMYLFKKIFGNYKKKIMKSSDYKNAIDFLSEKNSVILLESDKKNINEFHGVNMSKYKKGDKNKLIRAGLMLFAKQEALTVKKEIKDNWLKLIENLDFGTEENPLTMYYWDNNVEIMTLEEWVEILKLEQRIKLL